MSIVEVRTCEQIEELEARVRAATERIPAMLSEHSGDGLSLLRRLKFDPVGFHAFEDRRLNLIEQANQTFSILVSLRAARLLLDWHPEAEGYRLVLGPHRGMDIESIRPDVVAAEAFAAVLLSNNRKFKKDCARVAKVSAAHRYVFFHVPQQPEGRYGGSQPRGGVIAWSVSV